MRRNQSVGCLAVLATFACCFSLNSHAQTLSSFAGPSGSWHLGTLAVGNVDDDPALEIIIPARSSTGMWVVDAFDYTGARLKGFPYNGLTGPMNTSPTLVDIDSDGNAEIIFTHNGDVVALHGEDGSVAWKSGVGPLNYVPDAGFMARTGGFFWSAGGVPLAALPPTSAFFSEVSPPLVVDADGNGTLEILTAWKIDPSTINGDQDYNPVVNDIFGLGEWGATGESWSGGVVHMDARTGELDFTYHFHQLVESGLAAGQADDDAASEIYVLNDADSIAAYDASQPHGFLGSSMMHKQFGQNVRLLSGSYQTGVDVHVADIDGDGRDEVLVPTSRINPNWQPSATILDDDGAVLWREWHQPVNFPRTHGWFNSATMIPINPDHDNRVDVVTYMHSTELDVETWNGVSLESRSGWPIDFAPRMPTPPVVADIDGDGVEEIIVGTYDPNQVPSEGSLLIIGLDGLVQHAESIPGGIKHIPAIADVNRDGSNDLIFRSMTGQVYVWNFGAKPTSPVSWATHRGNMERTGRGPAALFPAGTPLVPEKVGNYRSNWFSWKGDLGNASSFEIRRSSDPARIPTRIATVGASTRSFVDTTVDPGVLYIYEVAASFPDRIVRSAPFAVRSDLNGNIVRNGGFEEDDDSHWDKWFSGDIPWENMRGSKAHARSGSHSMEIRMNGHRGNSTITQYSHYGIPTSYIPVTPGKLYSFGGFIKTTGLNAPSEHWFEWDSSKTAENTNNRPGLPWPLYFTPAASFDTGESPWVYGNRVLRMPEGFPNVQLRHRMATKTALTGSVFLDDVFFRPLPEPNDPRWHDFVPFGATWKFQTTRESDWMLPAFDDSAWQSSRAKFGAGSVVANVKTALPTKLPSYYFRTRFTGLETPLSELVLSATATDDYGGTVYPMKAYLNGIEISPNGIDAVSGEGNIVKQFDLTPFIPLIKPGENVLAMELVNNWQPTWDNIAFDVRLHGMSMAPRTETTPARFTRVRHLASGDVELTFTSTVGSQWVVQSSDSSSPFSWRTVGSLTIPAGGTAVIVDAGQNGRERPQIMRRRFYRLVSL